MKIYFEITLNKIIGLCQRISKILIYILVFLLPIFFLPFASNLLDFNKQILLAIFLFIVLFIWLLRTFLLGKIELNFNLFCIPVLIFLFFYSLSTFFSLSPRESFWGWPLNLSQGFLTLLLFAVFYFLVSNILNKKREIFWLFFVFLTSTFLATLFAIFQILIKNNFLNTVGSPNSLALFLAILSAPTFLLAIISKNFIPLENIFPFSSGSKDVTSHKSSLFLTGFSRLILAIYFIAFLFFLILINFSVAWITLVVEFSLLLFFGLFYLKKINRFSLVFFPVLVIILAFFFLYFKINLFKIQIPVEVSLNSGSEWTIMKSSFGNLKSLLLGIGPSTFLFDYSKFKPLEINQTQFWAVRFSQGASEIQDKLITNGIFGTFAFFSILGTFFWLLVKNFSLPEENFLSLGISLCFFGAVFSQFLYPINFLLLFLFWLILASFSGLNPKTKTTPFSIRSSAIFAAIFVLIFISEVGLSFILIKNYLAEIKYSQGINVWQKGNLDEAINFLEKAIGLNPNLDSYQRTLAQFYLQKFNDTLKKNQISSQFQEILSKSLDSAKRATEISPQDEANWNTKGFIYRNLIGLMDKADDPALKSYQTALELDPKNPYIFKEIGLIYLAKSDLLTRSGAKKQEISGNLDLARGNFQKAIELKSDYAPAHFQLAMIYQREGKDEEAISKLEETKKMAPFDPDLAFQLGILYYNKNQIEKAKSEFERAIKIDENYSNARYFLGLIYDKEGKKDLSIKQFEAIEKLNPDNSEVKKILENLRKNLPALEGISVPPFPVEKTPSEELGK